MKKAKVDKIMIVKHYSGAFSRYKLSVRRNVSKAITIIINKHHPRYIVVKKYDPATKKEGSILKFWKKGDCTE